MFLITLPFMRWQFLKEPRHIRHEEDVMMVLMSVWCLQELQKDVLYLELKTSQY